MKSKIVLFGAGDFGELTLKHLRIFHIEVECVVDNDSSKWGSSLEGVAIYSPEHLLTLGSALEIVVTMRNQYDVIRQLENLGFTFGKNIISYSEMLYSINLNLGDIVSGETKLKPIYNGFTPTYKFYIETAKKERYFLRVYDKPEHEAVEMETDISSSLASNGLDVPNIMNLGTIEGRAYILYEWISGRVLSETLGDLSLKEQYRIGLEAGEMLKKIHAIPVHEYPTLPSYNIAYHKGARYKTELFNDDDDGLHYVDRKLIIKNKGKEKAGKIHTMNLLHGDYHTGNIIIADSPNSSYLEPNLVVIDFGHAHKGAVEEDFSAIIADGYIHPLFATGVIHAYYNGEPHKSFWVRCSSYVTNRLLGLVCGRDDDVLNLSNQLIEHKSRVLSSYNNPIEADVPYWYISQPLVYDSDYMKFYQTIHTIYYTRQRGFCLGIFYQGLESLNIYGIRPTEFRFAEYGLDKILTKEHSVLDVACNCGFMSLCISEHVRKVVGVELDQSLVKIANITAEYLSVTNCSFYCQDFKEFKTEEKFDIILSFAVHHWLGVSMEEYGDKLSSLLNPGGIILLESHQIEPNGDFDKITARFAGGRFEVIYDGDIADYVTLPRKFKILKLLS